MVWFARCMILLQLLKNINNINGEAHRRFTLTKWPKKEKLLCEILSEVETFGAAYYLALPEKERKIFKNSKKIKANETGGYGKKYML